MVVKASGVSKPTVYNHFPDKSALINEVLQRWIDEMRAEYQHKFPDRQYVHQQIGMALSLIEWSHREQNPHCQEKKVDLLFFK